MEMPEMPGLVGETPEAPSEPELPEEPEMAEPIAPDAETIVTKAKEAVEEARFHANDAVQLAGQVPEAKPKADEATAAADEAQEAYTAVEEAAAAVASVDPEDLNATRDAAALVQTAAAPVFDALERAMTACEEIRSIIPLSKTAEPGLGADLMTWAKQTLQSGGE